MAAITIDDEGRYRADLYPAARSASPISLAAGDVDTLDRPAFAAPAADEAVLALSLPDILQRRIAIPEAAKRDIAGVLRLDMDRQTPFSADEVRFAWRILGRDERKQSLTVLLTVVRSEIVTEAERFAAQLGLRLFYLGPHPHPPWQDNLVGAPTATAHRRLRFGLVAITVLLAAAALWLPLHRQQQAIDDLARDLRAARASAEQIAAERAAYAGIEAVTGALDKAPGSVLDLLLALTAALPDSASLHRLSWHDGRIEIAGRAREAADVIRRIGATGRFANIEYQSSLTSDESGEQFTLSFGVARTGTP